MHTARLRLAASLTLGLGLAAACHGASTGLSDSAALLASCGSATQVFSVIPVDPARITGWVPLGNLNPPAHTFPTDHQYLYLTNVNFVVAETPLLAPGEITITSARTSRDVSSSTGEYSVTFAACREIVGGFGHVRSITPSLLTKIGPFDQNCSTYSPAPGQTFTGCNSRPVRVTLHAGDTIGTVAGLDLSLWDTRITPLTFANNSRWPLNGENTDRFHVVPFSDYYRDPTRTQVRSLLGQFDGAVKRTVEPLGGSIATDIAGTVQGAWFDNSQPANPESPHLTIVPDNVDPSMVDLSIGISQPGFTTSVYRMFPVAGGTANTAPSLITPGSTIYCYDVRRYFGFSTFARMLLRLSDVTTLTVEMQSSAGTCADTAPWSFTSGMTFTYKR